MKARNPLLVALKMQPAFNAIPRQRIYTTSYKGDERFRVKLFNIGYKKPSTRAILSHLLHLGWRDVNVQCTSYRFSSFYSLTIKASK
jgi:hypothetical protein